MPSPSSAADLIVFTDLDGTLLDHTSYDHTPAHPTLGRLNTHNIPLVLASSKTAVEMVSLRHTLGFDHCPLICENGAGVVSGGALPDQNPAAYLDLRAALDRVPSGLRTSFEGFGDMTPARIRAVTDLSLDQARLAAQRAFSEPGIWTGSDAECAQFLTHLAQQGISARRGGRFLTLSFGDTKANQMGQITTQLGRQTTIALGDAPNDTEMLNAADYAIVLPNAHGHPVTVSKADTSRVIHAKDPGPRGWNKTLGGLLSQLGVAD